MCDSISIRLESKSRTNRSSLEHSSFFLCPLFFKIMIWKEEGVECSVLEIFFEKVLTEYTGDKLNMKVAEDKLDKNVVAGIGYYIVFVSNHDGKFLVEHA